jgi:hypothetical protein
VLEPAVEVDPDSVDQNLVAATIILHSSIILEGAVLWRLLTTRIENNPRDNIDSRLKVNDRHDRFKEELYALAEKNEKQNM